MNLLSVKEIAEVLGHSEQHVRVLLREGKLPGEKIGRQWVLPEDALDLSGGGVSGRGSAVPDHPKKNGRLPKLKALSFFSGAMGLDIGLEKAGLRVLLASEIDKATRETIQLNRPDMALIGDIREYSSKEIRQAAGLAADEDIHLVVGGPPCQAFSTAGKRQGFEDDRGNVFLTFIDPRFPIWTCP